MKTRLVAFLALGLAGCAVTSGDDPGSSSDAITRGSIATIAHANLGKGACSTTTTGAGSPPWTSTRRARSTTIPARTA